MRGDYSGLKVCITYNVNLAWGQIGQMQDFSSG